MGGVCGTITAVHDAKDGRIKCVISLWPAATVLYVLDKMSTIHSAFFFKRQTSSSIAHVPHLYHTCITDEPLFP